MLSTVFLLFLGRLIVRGTFFNLFFDAGEHFLDLCDAGFQFRRITVPLIVGEGTLEAVPRIFPFLQKHVAEGYPIEGITLLVVIAHLQLLLVERNALAVMPQIEMTLSIRKIVETAFMRGIDVKFGDDRIKTGRCLLVVPLVIVASSFWKSSRASWYFPEEKYSMALPSCSASSDFWRRWASIGMTVRSRRAMKTYFFIF